MIVYGLKDAVHHPPKLTTTMLSLRFFQSSSCTVWYLTLVFALVGCSAVDVESDNLAAIDVELGKSFELIEGQRARIKGTNLVLTFESLLGDSRCPVSTETTINCFWEGAVQAAFQLEGLGEPITLNFDGFVGDGSSAIEQKAGEYVVLLERMEPYPQYDSDTKDPNVATLRIERS